jgi:hypothetical protein
MRDTTVNGAFQVSLVQGRVLAERSSLLGAVHVVSQESSVYFIDTPVPDVSQAASVSWRQTDMRTCLGASVFGYGSPTSTPYIDADPGGAFQCGSKFSVENFGTYFDPGKDGFVTLQEFETTLGWDNYWNSLGKCCGLKCPFASWCNGFAYQFFDLNNNNITGGGGYNDRATYLSVTAAFNAVKNAPKIGAMLVPYCYRTARFEPHNATSSSSTSWKVEAGGEIRVMLQYDAAGSSRPSLPALAREVEDVFTKCTDAYAAANSSDSDGDLGSNCTGDRGIALEERVRLWAPVEVRSPSRGLRMLPHHARLLQKEVGKEFGDLLTTKEAYVVIDVVASPGVPRSRWIYATRPVFHAIEPYLLFFVSAGLLTPPIKHYRVELMDASCDLNFTNYMSDADDDEFAWPDVRVRYADENERLAEVYTQIFYALHGDGNAIFNTGLRGELVYADPDNQGKYKNFVRTTDGFQMLTTGPDPRAKLRADMLTAVWLSICVGGVLGMFTMWSGVKYLQWLLDYHHRQERGRLTVLEANGEADSSGEAPDPMAEKKRNFFMQLIDTPFTRPILMINILVVQPLRRRYVNALDKFLLERCVFHNKIRADIGSHWRKKFKIAPEEPVVQDSNRPSYIYLRDLKRRFEVFCARESLSATTVTEADMMKSLIMKHECRIAVHSVRRMQGVRWVKDINTLRCTAALDAKSKRLEVMQAFFDCHIEVTGDKYADCIDVEDRKLPNGNMKLGMYEKLCKFCSESGVPAFSMEQLSPDNAEGALSRVCRSRMVPFKEIDIKEVHGISFVELSTLQKEGVRTSKKWLVMQLVTVGLHIVVLLGPSVILTLYALAVQSMHALTESTKYSVASWEDVLGKYPIEKKVSDFTPLVQWIIMYHFVFATITYVRLAVFYMEVPDYAICKATRIAFALMLIGHVFMIFVIVGIMAAWFVLAALLDPTKFLPYGTAVIVFVLVVKSTYAELTAVAAFLKKEFRKIFDMAIAHALRNARQEILQRKQDAMASKMIDTAGGMRHRVIDDGLSDPLPLNPPANAKDSRADANPAVLFKILDKDESGDISIGEFKGLLRGLDLGITEPQMEQLFAYCDVDSSGGTSAKELEESWEFLVTTLMEAAAQGMGVSATDIALTCIMLATTLALLLAFIFLALQGWYNESSFDSMVQAVMISLSGKAIKHLRKKAKAEGDPDSVKAAVEDMSSDGAGDGGDGADGGG